MYKYWLGICFLIFFNFLIIPLFSDPIFSPLNSIFISFQSDCFFDCLTSFAVHIYTPVLVSIHTTHPQTLFIWHTYKLLSAFSSYLVMLRSRLLLAEKSTCWIKGIINIINTINNFAVCFGPVWSIPHRKNAETWCDLLWLVYNIFQLVTELIFV